MLRYTTTYLCLCILACLLVGPLKENGKKNIITHIENKDRKHPTSTISTYCDCIVLTLVIKHLAAFGEPCLTFIALISLCQILWSV